MGNVHSNTYVGKVEAVAEPNQADSDDVVRYQFLEIFSRLLEHQHEHNGLLGPVTSLQQIVRLDDCLMGSVGESLVHASSIKVPHRSTRHDPYAKWTVDSKVKSSVCLLHETRLLIPVADAKVKGNGADETLHAKLAGKAQDNGVEADESEIPSAFAIV